MSTVETTPVASDWDPMTPESLRNPVAVHEQMRSQCPVAYSEQFGGFWALFNRDDIMYATRETEVFVSTPAISVPAFSSAEAPWVPLQADPPDHRHYRKILTPFFATTRLAGFEPKLIELANEAIDEFIEKGEADIALEFSYRLPATALCLLLGLPVSDWVKLHTWSIDIIRAAGAGDLGKIGDVYAEMYRHADEWMALRRQEPTGDLMSALVAGEVNGRPMTKPEIRGMFALLIVAGHETTANAISNIIHLLATNPNARTVIGDGTNPPPDVMTEIVRYCCSVQAMGRTTAREVTLGGREIPSGSPVALMFGSGCRDESVFGDPHTFDPSRESSPNLTFGWGIHRCLGEQLARIEMKVAMQCVIRRLKNLTVVGKSEPALWSAMGFHSLTVHFDKGIRSAAGKIE